MNTIISSQNPLIKEVKQLKDRKHREDRKMFFIEGTRFVEEALNDGIEIVRILLSDRFIELNSGNEVLKEIEGKGIEVFILPDKLFKEVSDTENPQGILAVLRIKEYSLDDIVNENNFIIVLDGIQDPGNMGTIIRTADAAGAGAVIVLKGSVDIYNPKVLRSTMGSIFHLPVCLCENSGEFFKKMKAKDIKVYAAHLDGVQDYFELDLKRDVAFVIGNEANGISSEIESMTDALVRIPMPGRAESLNASVAAALLMYEVVRARKIKG